MTEKKNIKLIHSYIDSFTHWFKITIFLIFVIIPIILIFSSCRDKPTPPSPDDDTPKPGKRDYVWKIDTLAYPGSFQTMMYDIWASSPTNVYVVGHNDQPGPGTMFRYDGTSWKTTRFHVADGGTVSGAISLSAIYGFGPNDIYAVGESIYENPNPPPNFLDSSLIIHFNGISWREVQIQKGRNLQAVHGAKSDNVWFGGIYGTAYRYDGIRITNINTESNLWFNDIEVSSLQVYGLAYTPNPGNYTIHYLLKSDSNTWVVVDSFTEVGRASAKFGHGDIKVIDGTFYSVGFGVFKKENNKWIKMFDTNYDTFVSIYGTRDEHIFVTGVAGVAYHFNGSNWQKINIFDDPDLFITGVWCNEDEVFIVGEDGYKTYIYHGK